MRELVGRPEPEAVDQPRGQPVFDFPREQYEFVLDFGCGCGRVARQLALAAAPTPKRYVGTDLHAGMIDWCNANRVLRADGVMFATFFLFEKAYFPMMQDFQNALYINANDPTNAALLDREWLIDALHSRGLGVRASLSPTVRAFHWDMQIARGESAAALEPDRAPFGRRPPPVPTSPAQAVGADEGQPAA